MSGRPCPAAPAITAPMSAASCCAPSCMPTESRTATPLDAAMAAARNGDVRAARARAPRFAGQAKPALAVNNTARVTRARHWRAAMRSPELTTDERAALARLEPRLGRLHIQQRLGLEHDHEAQVFRR